MHLAYGPGVWQPCSTQILMEWNLVWFCRTKALTALCSLTEKSKTTNVPLLYCYPVSLPQREKNETWTNRHRTDFGRGGEPSLKVLYDKWFGCWSGWACKLNFLKLQKSINSWKFAISKYPSEELLQLVGFVNQVKLSSSSCKRTETDWSVNIVFKSPKCWSFLKCWELTVLYIATWL